MDEKNRIKSDGKAKKKRVVENYLDWYIEDYCKKKNNENESAANDNAVVQGINQNKIL